MEENNSHNLGAQEGLASLDAHGSRVGIIPATVEGYWYNWRRLVRVFLVGIFLILPWTKMNGLPTLMLDVAHRKFSIFGVLFLAHDGPLLFFVFAAFAFTAAFVTAVWGRVWCGWACPQTVFIEGVYRRIEAFVEGNYIERRKLRDQEEITFAKVAKKVIKWFLFFVVSSLIAHCFIAYFTGSDQMIEMIKEGPKDNWTYFLLVTGMTAILLLDFGWFREQFCIIMCPYGRFQSVLMDQHTTTILYDESRGEPRRGAKIEGAQAGKTGDCVACNRCVQVCPTGIDIRKGVQLECIGCTACIDACNDIMAKVNKKPNLISYKSLSGKFGLLRPRALIYLFGIIVGLSGIFYNFFDRSSFMVTLLRAKETPYQIVGTGVETKIINHFKLHVHNQTFKAQSYEVILPDELKAQNVQLTLPQSVIEVAASDEKIIHFFVIYPRGLLAGKDTLKSQLTVKPVTDQAAPISKDLFLVGPAD